ncbi:clathrin light chain B isoform X2 [Lingula anatina]|uniref:Clathrin light chain n=1 Tax=Lingula anatina TaxID=7574 RepID=A0A1S3K655_LINAN|nr:clathrin light chain B isoform X2 [Lingula anatina]|eukprot:XP_013417992.1 clathrin light chain B isoform X2 [Lingula anatina]
MADSPVGEGDFDPMAEISQTEADPAAAFLAREQDELAGLEDDTFGVSGGQQSGGQDFGFDDDLEQPPQQQSNVGDFLDDFGAPPPAATSGGEFDSLGGYDNQEYNDMNGPSDTYSAISQVDRQRQEPEKIRLWREQQKERLEKKDADEAEKKEEWREAAKKEMEDWYKHRAEQLQKTKETNRAAEADFVKERDETIPGGEWEKICRLCEFNPKGSKTTKDISRMRSILLQLKQTPLVR